MRQYGMTPGAALVIAMLLMTAGAPGIGAAQSAGPSDVPKSGAIHAKTRTWTDPNIATLMLVESLGYAGARAVVVRRPGESPNNIILVTRATTSTDLANAASALIVSR